MENNETTNVETKVEEPLKEGEILTQTVSIASEEERTGQKIEIPSADEIVKRAATSLINCQRQIHWLSQNMSRKCLTRAITAAFDLPQDKLPVMLKTDEEKQFFAIAQRAQADKFLLLQHHIYQETQKQKLEEEQIKKLEEERIKAEQAAATEQTSVENTTTNNEQGVN